MYGSVTEGATGLLGTEDVKARLTYGIMLRYQVRDSEYGSLQREPLG